MIDLDRSFDRVYATTNEQFSREWSRSSDSSINWESILDHPATVILGDPGTGKSTEFERQAAKLREEGRVAFNLTVSDVALNKLEDALDSSMLEDWDRWINSDKLQARFFVDSIDEARINQRDVRTAFRNLSRGIHKYAHRVTIIISCRPAAWFLSDKDIVAHALSNVCNRSQSISDEDPEDVLLDPIFRRDSTPGHQEPLARKVADKREDVAILRLLPLDQDQQAKYIRERSPSFSAEIIEASALAPHALFLGRPLDIDNAIAYWEENRRFGSRFEMMDAGIKRGLRESNSNRNLSGKISPQDARFAARTLAAALALAQEVEFSPRGEDEVPEKGVVNCRDVFPNVSDERLSELLDRALYPQAHHATQRLLREHQDFLAAEWLVMLRGNGLPLLDLLLVTFVGSGDERKLRPSMRSVAPWIAQRDASFREDLVKVDALALFEGGDPSLIPEDERAAILESYLEQLDHRDVWRPLLYDTEAAWFSAGLTEQHIRDLWNRYSALECRIVLLLIIECGKRVSLVDLVLGTAVRSDTSGRVRRRAIETIAAIGDKQTKSTLASAARERGLEWPSRNLDSLIEALLPAEMSVSELRRQLILRDASYDNERVVASITEVVGRLKDASALGVMLLKLVGRSPLDSDYRPLSVRFGFLLPALQKICEKLLTGIGMPVELYPALKLLHRVSRDRHEPKVESNRIVEVSQEDAQFRRSLVEFAMRSDSEIQERPWMLQYDWPIRIDESDVDWALDGLRSKELSDLDLALLNFVFWGISHQESRSKLRRKLGQAVKSSSRLETRLRELDKGRARALREQRAYERKEEARKIKSRSEEESAQESWRELQQLLSAEPQRITSREDLEPGQPPRYSLDLTHWIKTAKSKDRASYTSGGSQLLGAAWGVDVQQAFEQAVTSYWPSCEVGLLSNGESLTNWNEVGFIGITTLAEKDPNWAVHLSDREAEVAACYSFRDLNGFASWLEALLEHNLRIVGDLFENECLWELVTEKDAPAPHHCVYKLGYSSDRVQGHLVPRLLSATEKVAIENLEVLRAVLKVLVPNFPADKERYVRICRERFTAARINLWDDTTDEAIAQYWLAAWFYCDAAGASNALREVIRNRSQTKKDRFVGGLITKLVSHSELSFATSDADFDQPQYLMELTKLAYLHVRPADDVIHEGIRSLGRRDEEERSRSGLLERTIRSLGTEAPRYLRKISSEPWVSSLSKYLPRKASDLEVELADSIPWTAAQVLDYGAVFTKPVNSARDLYDLTNRVLNDIRLDSQGGDFSLDVLQMTKVEAHHQQYLAHELNWHSRGRFVVSREEEVHQRKRPDIVLKNEGAGRVAIEIKVVDGNWTYTDLMDASKAQIIRRYLVDKDASYAIFVLIRCNQQRWKDPKGKWADFETLVDRIRSKTARVVDKSPGVDAIAVVPIDLRVS